MTQGALQNLGTLPAIKKVSDEKVVRSQAGVSGKPGPAGAGGSGDPGLLYAAATDALAPRHVVKGRLG